MAIDNVNVPIEPFKDIELSGAVNRSVGQGASFALILAMIEADILNRPRYVESKSTEQSAKLLFSSINYYRPYPLYADEKSWKSADLTGQSFHQNIQDGLLWQAMHPQPLSIFNQPERIDDEVLSNCDIYTQNRVKNVRDKSIQVDETGLYDILQKIA